MNEYLKNTLFHTRDVARGVRHYLTNMRIVVLIVVAIFVGGIVMYKSLPQTVAPEINLSMIVVSAALPGATPENVESLVTIPLEDALKGISGIDTVVSSSQNGSMRSILTFVRGVTEDRALADVENAIGRVSVLPEDVTEPLVKAIDFEDAPIVRLAFGIEGDSMTSLSGHMEKLVDVLEADPLIDRVLTSGQPKQEVQIMIVSEKMTSLGIDIGTVRRALDGAVNALPSGIVEGDGVTRALTINATIDDIEDIRTTIVEFGGVQYTMGDLATIVERPAPGYTNAWLATGETVRSIVTLDIYRTRGTDITDAAHVVDDIIAEAIAQSDGILQKTVLMNIADDLTQQFDDLARNLGITIILVFITLMLFIGWRQALLAAFSIPLTYAIAFIVMGIVGISVNFLSLFSLLLSLGLLVDVTIVVVSAMSAYMREGNFSPAKTGFLVYRDFFVTLLMTTLTTVWAFVPLLLAGGIIGEYIKPIPVIVSSILLASVFIGIFVILPLMIWLFDFTMPRRVRFLLIGIGAILVAFFIVIFTQIAMLFVGIISIVLIALFSSGWYVLHKKSHHLHMFKKKNRDEMVYTIINVRALEVHYRRFLDQILASRFARRRTIAIVIIFFIFSFGLVGTGFVKNEFFPGEDVAFFFVSVELPQGTNSLLTEATAQEILPTLTQLDGVTGVTMQVGFDINQNGEVGAIGTNKALLTVLTPTEGDSSVGSQAVAKQVRAMPMIRDFADAKVTVVEFSGGPPAGADVVITFAGEDVDVLRTLAHELKDHINEINMPVENVDVSPELAAATVTFVPDDAILHKMGVSRFVIAEKLRLYASGVTLAEDVELASLAKKRDIVLRLSIEHPDVASLGRVMIATQQGNFPLETLGRFELSQSISRIDRSDFDRVVTLSAGLRGKANLVDVNTEIETIINKKMDLPRGYTWSSGGANEENNESVQSILQGMLLAFALIFLTLIVHLKSYRKAAIVLLTIPLAASGVFIVFALFGIPLSFPALIGVLALFGIVVNNAIIIISQINANKSVGMGYQQSIVEGASSRLEPILLSSLTTVIGLTPITLSDPVWMGLGGAIISGLLFSGVIMLFFIPVVYYIFMRDEKEIV